MDHGERSDGAMSPLTMSGGEQKTDGPLEYCPGSPLSLSPLPSPTGRRRSAKKRMVTVPLADLSGTRPKGVGEGNTPTDSWAWRKYGQKPIKGSPFPRAYYRCSSSKGCPARKQVERSRDDPAMVIVTYSFEHNHSGPVPRAQNRQSHKPKPQPGPPEPDTPAAAGAAAPVADDAAIDVHDEFRWFYDVVSVASTSTQSDEADEMLYGPMFLGAADTAATLLPDECVDMEGLGGEGGEEDALFAGLDELPECSMVFRRRVAGGLAGGVNVEPPPAGTAMS